MFSFKKKKKKSLFLFNRNPDNDAGPWCHTYKNMILTWELCDVRKCCEFLYINEFIWQQ